MAAHLILRHATFPTPLGPFTVVASGDGVMATTSGEPVSLLEALERRLEVRSRPAALRAAGRDLQAYFAGRGHALRTPVDLRLASTPFARAVLEVVAAIPYAEIWTYGDVAAGAGRPRAGRAAGTVLAHSPVELFVPCHRVVPAGPGLGSYGDDDRRAFLLRLEHAI
jgi:methylated-DNA-[protein]-cysteine S-methyltransferase